MRRVVLLVLRLAWMMVRRGMARVAIHLVLGIVGREEAEARRQRTLLRVDVVDDADAAS